MRLAKLTVNGFKSFADKTEFTFESPITGVVGPNGCGKSNIVDAVKWVLGERSAKSLRGKEMQDVIFAGSAGRKPSGLASVILTFENPEMSEAELAALATEDSDGELGRWEGDGEEGAGVRGGIGERVSEDSEAGDAGYARSPGARRGRRRYLAIDTETVDIERRLYRDGTSQYLINGRKARLRDIRELFMDTGIGAHAYSIIEQGKVDTLLLANPVERRIFFEEAAGVALFKARRIEAQRKLERTETNLVRVREQLDSTERRLRIVRGQANKARKFKALDERLRALRMALAFDQYEELSERLNGLTSRIQDLEAERDEAMEEVARLEGEKQEAELRRHELGEAAQAAERERTAAEHRRESASQRMEMTEHAIAEARRQIENDRERLEALGRRIEALDREAEDKVTEANALEARLAEVEGNVEELAARRERLAGDVAERRQAAAEKRAAVASIDRERASLAAQLESDSARLRTLREEATKLGSKRAALERERAEIGERIDEAERAIDARRGVIEGMERELEAMVSSATSLSGEQRALTERLNELEQRQARLDSRRGTLEEMARERVGLGEAVKGALERRDRSRAAGSDDLWARIQAPLAELIEVRTENAGAVEAALGPLLQALVVDRIDPTLDADALRELPGRVTLLTMEGGARHAPVMGAGSARIERLPVLTELVRCGAQHERLIQRLLGRTYLVRDLDAAMMALAGGVGGDGARFVTREGVALEPDGRVVAGPLAETAEGGGLLQRAGELHDLEREIADLDGAIERDRDTLRSVDERVRELNEALAARRVALATEQRALIGDESRLERMRADTQRLERESTITADELTRAEERSHELEESQRGLGERIERLRRLHDEEADVAAQLERAIETTSSELETVGEKLTAARIEVSRLREQGGAARRELRRAEVSAEDARRERERLEGQLAGRVGQIEEHERVIGAAREEIERAGREAEEARASQMRFSGALEEIARETERLSETLGGARKRAQIVERDWSSLELSKRELEVRRETLEERSQEDIGLDLAWEYPEYRAMMADGDVARIDQEDVGREVDELRGAIAKLGNVNLDAIDEEHNLEERNDDLIQQVADIDRAVHQLGELIVRLSDASRTRFKETFETIQEHFSGKSGMFRRLFGGGRAELRLVPDDETGEIDWLESGIEVVAKPPGKEPRSISQLSGGEKTMTAVALLMSIFQSKPSPFCILDEVDAALDDANVERYCTIVRQFLDQCHFIVITHNKKTMQIAEHLYGVTMQERGVSKRVHVRLDQVAGDGKIAQSAIDEEARREQAASAEDTARESRATGENGSLRRQLAEMRREDTPVEVGEG